MSTDESGLVASIRARLRAAAEPERAAGMQAYMKSAMPYLGVRVPVVRAEVRAAMRADPFDTAGELRRIVLDLWDAAEYREERYAATAVLGSAPGRRLATPDLLPVLHHLVVTGAWWDHVDELAHRVGDLLTRWPAEVRPMVRSWQRDPDRWLRRVAILCQLGAGPRTDVDLLVEAVDANAADPDFFVRKAIGWALRDYARTDPPAVRAIVASHALSPLSRREALKHLDA